jgi:hypothetical protein
VRNADGLLEAAPPFATAPPMLVPSAERRPFAADFGGPQPAIPVSAVEAVRVKGPAVKDS